MSFPGGAARRAAKSTRAWVLIDDGSPRRFGAALAWAWSRGADFADLHLLVEGAEAAGVVARRAAEMASAPSVWVVSGRSLTPAQPAPADLPEAADPDILPYLTLLRAHGVEPVVEHGVLRGEVLGLEVARLIDGRLEVGVGRHDRYARAMLGRDENPGRALDEAVAAVSDRRRPGAGSHPANTLARSRWLRAVVCAAPGLVGATVLTAVAPPLPLADLTDNGAVPCVGLGPDGDPVVVVCSTGVDPDLVPSAADSRRIYLPEARLVIVVPEGDDHPVTRALAGALARPAEVRTVPRSWEGLGPASPASAP